MKKEIYLNKIAYLYSNPFFVFVGFSILFLTSGHAFQILFIEVRLLPVLYCFIFFPLLYYQFKKRGIVDLISYMLIIAMLFLKIILEGFNNINFYLSLISVVTMAKLFSITIDLRKFNRIFSKFMNLIVLVSIVFYLLINFTNIGDNFFSFFSFNWIEYSTIGIFHYIRMIPHRNGSIFWEPSIFATYIILNTIIILEKDKDKLKMIKLLLNFVGIISTLSVISIIMFIVLVIIDLTKTKLASRDFKYKKVFSIIVILVVIFYVSIYSTQLKYNVYFQKVLIENILQNPRMDSIIFNLQMLFSDLKSFFIGNLYSVILEKSTLSTNYYDLATIFLLVNLFGVLIIPYIYKNFKKLYKLFQNRFFGAFVTLTLFVLLNKEPHIRFTIFWTYVFLLEKTDPV